MKLSTCLGYAALLLSVSAYAQTSQTFTFGEGQTTLNGAHARPSHGAQTQPKAKPKHARTQHPASAPR
ncbi:hypothetical protein P3T43_004860 [Paraburkholderia sp. GAS41]|jgi:hypothetical protein|uniref:hypothetical protein n=1 Tax=Paraburkholderia sp. GAS41 TaxID=3035134 RepID=UPI003D21FDD2